MGQLVEKFGEYLNVNRKFKMGFRFKRSKQLEAATSSDDGEERGKKEPLPGLRMSCITGAELRALKGGDAALSTFLEAKLADGRTLSDHNFERKNTAPSLSKSTCALYYK